MSDYYMPPSSRDRERDRERDRDRDRDRGDSSTSQGFVKRESTWRPKSQPSRPANAWATRDSPRDSPGPSRKVDAYYEPLRADDREKDNQDGGRDKDERGKERERDRSRSREREPVRDPRDGDRGRDRSGDGDTRDREQGRGPFRDQRQGWRKKDDDRGTWEDYRRRRRSPARWARDRDRDRDRVRDDRDRDRDPRWARDRDDDRRDRDVRGGDRRDAAESRDRDERRNRWAKSPEPARRSPSPLPKRKRSPVLRRGANTRASPDYGLGRRSDSDSDEPRRLSPPRRSSPSPASRGRSPSPPSRRRSPSPPPRRRSPSPEKRRLPSPSLPDAKRAREISPPPRGRSPYPLRRGGGGRSPPPRDRDRDRSRDRSMSRSPNPRRIPIRNGRGRDDPDAGRRARSPDSPPRFNRGRWGNDSDRWQPQQARKRWGEPTKMRQWGRPASPSSSPGPSPRPRSRSRSSARSKDRDNSLPPGRPPRDPRDREGLPYSSTPEREQPPPGANGGHPVRAAMRDWKPAPTGPAAHRNGNAQAGPIPRPTQRPEDDGSDIVEEDMDLDDYPPPPPQPRRSDKWSPVKRSSPRRPSAPVAPVPPTGPSSQSMGSVSRPPAPSGPVARPAFVPRTSAPSAPASVASSAPSRPASGPSTPRGSDTLLNLMADKQQQFDRHLSTIAPYISTAFGQWYAQNASPALHPFLIHHFGRQPTKLELDQIHQLLRMRTQLTRDQQELRHLHAQAVRSEGPGPAPAPSAPLGPRATRERNAQLQRGVPPTGPAAQVMPQHPATSERAGTPPSSSSRTRARAVAGEAYERLAQVGEGTYGKVYKARNTGNGSLVALKRIRMEQERDGFPVTSMREIKLLQALDHVNIVRLMEMMVSNNSVYMVLEYMNHDLTGILSHPEVSLSPANIKSLNYQMLSGLGYLHRRGILHRDMKGSNILLNGEGELKLADFGLARWYHKHKRDDYTNRVITLWYRSPELLMGETAYGPEVDTWSAGCIMLEIFTSKPTFQGQDEISQLDAIWAIMGTPTQAGWPEVKELPWYELVRPREVVPSQFEDMFGKALSRGALDVVRGLLEFNPAKRLLADDALRKPYFTTEEPKMERPTQLAACGEHHEMSVKMHRRREGK